MAQKAATEGEKPRNSGEGFESMSPGLLVEIVDELGNPVKGASVQALIMEKGKENLGGMTFVVKDGVRQEFAGDEDGEENGAVLFEGKRWEAFGKAGNLVRLTVEGEGLVSRFKTISLNKGRNLTATRLNFPLKMLSKSPTFKGVTLKVGGRIIKDGSNEDWDGLENGQIYAKLPVQILRSQGESLVVQPRGAGKAGTRNLPPSPYGWQVDEEKGTVKIQTRKPNED